MRARGYGRTLGAAQPLLIYRFTDASFVKTAAHGLSETAARETAARVNNALLSRRLAKVPRRTFRARPRATDGMGRKRRNVSHRFADERASEFDGKQDITRWLKAEEQRQKRDEDERRDSDGERCVACQPGAATPRLVPARFASPRTAAPRCTKRSTDL